jgi:hypothetical protein
MDDGRSREELLRAVARLQGAVLVAEAALRGGRFYEAQAALRQTGKALDATIGIGALVEGVLP